MTADDSRNILQSALYNPNLYGQNQKTTRPYNWVVINTKDKEGNNRFVLLELSPKKENAEIVHWHYIDDKELEKLKDKPNVRTGNSSYCLPNRKRLVPFPALRTTYLLIAKLRTIPQTAKRKM